MWGAPNCCLARLVKLPPATSVFSHWIKMFVSGSIRRTSPFAEQVSASPFPIFECVSLVSVLAGSLTLQWGQMADSSNDEPALGQRPVEAIAVNEYNFCFPRVPVILFQTKKRNRYIFRKFIFTF
ncbi:hypothetical protein AVEN_222907-1 [Araneus ventricosus]|uniref:Uncharacterized protein n=1 Tax=Araneus ventricosus TaxID=182803 RepID=A0A4Y2W946_ARAVE|nr:hypothetical protein AVEN_222907-1 [Araneus ventricosus]